MLSGIAATPVALNNSAVSALQQNRSSASIQERANSLIADIEEFQENPNGLTSRLSSSNASVLLQAQEEQTNAEGLTPEEEEVVEDLKQTDREVRAHEQAHKSAAGPYAGPISYETTTGPDGREYAVGGSVQIDVSPIPGNPEATIRKADIVERAALAPADPSPEDFAVARAAQSLRQEAQRELSEQREAEQAERRGDDDEESGDATSNLLDFSEAQTILSTINQLA